MLHTLLLIFKIIGIVILVLLGIVLFLLLLVLFVPVRYGVDGSYYGRPKGKGKVSWLLHIFSVTAAYEEDLKVTVRIFGIPIRKPADKEPEPRETEEELVHAMEVTDEKKTEDGSFGKPEENSASEQASPPQSPPPEQTWPARRRPTLFSRLQTMWNLILSKLKFSFRRICDTLKGIKDKKDQVKAWIKDPANQKTIRLVWRQLKKILRHILPRKGTARITFGFDDPYTTGQILTYATMIYPLCHRHLELYPVFDRSVLEGEGSFKGRIRIGVLLSAAVRVLLNKNFRTILRRWL